MQKALFLLIMNYIFDAYIKVFINLKIIFSLEATIEFAKIEGKCYVVYGGNLIETPEEYAAKGPHRFYFNEVSI